jgi:hypothetical protein
MGGQQPFVILTGMIWAKNTYALAAKMLVT